MKKLAMVASLILAFGGIVRAQGKITYQIDPAHSSAQFVVRHLGISNVRGEFSKISGSVELDDKDITNSKVSATIPIDTVDTREPDRDADLKSDHFFDVAHYPAMSFTSKRIFHDGSSLKMTGDLTLHGVTREVTLDLSGPAPEIKDPWGNLRRGAEATGKLSRKDFGMTFDSGKIASGDFLIGDDISLTIDVEFIRKP
ncbi:MAG: YceI family protein [Candidatus Acidiferrales bacterium]